MDIGALRTDTALEEEGVWRDIGDGARLKIARLGNPAYKAEWEKRSKPYKRQIRNDSLPTEKANELLYQCLARAVLLDWDGLDEDGQPVPYSRENAVRLLREIRDFRDLVVSLADDAEAYRREAIEDAEGN